MSQRLRFTGPLPQTFITGNAGEVEPGGEFDVADELAETFLRRPDIERVIASEEPAEPAEDEVAPPRRQARAKDAAPAG